MKKLSVLILLLFLFFSGFPQKALEKKIELLDQYFASSLVEWNVPGMAVAIVKDGEIIFSKGYGVRNMETGEPVNGNTLFAIASNSKAFTSAALAILIDEGLLEWGDKVRKHLPWFELYDPYVSENMTIRDLLTHRSGLATFSGDLIWYGTGYSRKEVVQRAKYLKPVYGFREHFGYSNIMYLTAGLIIEKVAGMSWDEFIRERILIPLEMNRTVSSTNDLTGLSNVSAPHNDLDEDIITIDWLNWDNISPAGGLISSVNDVSQWLLFQLNKGVTKVGDTLIDPERFSEMWAPQTIQYVSSFSENLWPSTHFKAYGLGWALMDYQGSKVIDHGGGYDGFISNTTFVPEQDLGFTILTNKNTALYYPLRFKILDVMLNSREENDWSSEILELVTSREKHEKENQKKAEADRLKNTSPTLPVEDYLGTYHCKLYGDAEVYLQGDQLMVHLLPTDIFVGHLDHWQYNTWQIEFTGVPSLPKGLVNFTINANGGVDEMIIDVPNPDFDFTELIFKK